MCVVGWRLSFHTIYVFQSGKVFNFSVEKLLNFSFALCAFKKLQ